MNSHPLNNSDLLYFVNQYKIILSSFIHDLNNVDLNNTYLIDQYNIYIDDINYQIDLLSSYLNLFYKIIILCIIKTLIIYNIIMSNFNYNYYFIDNYVDLINSIENDIIYLININVNGHYDYLISKNYELIDNINDEIIHLSSSNS
jgi:hypothetical protein